MKIRPISDIHLDHSKYILPKLDTDPETTLVVAGDIAESTVKALDLAEEFFKIHSERFKHVVYVLGNHDYYAGSIRSSVRKFKERTDSLPNVHLLQNSSVCLDDVWFHGATLWTDCGGGSPFAQIDWTLMSDWKEIRYHAGSNDYAHKFGVGNVCREFTKSLQYLVQVLREHQDGKPHVVVTHHAPSLASLDHERFAADDNLSKFYASSLEESFMDFPDLKYMIHGHIHSAKRYRLAISEDSPEVIVNPRGYYSPGNIIYTGFDPTLIIEV